MTTAQQVFEIIVEMNKQHKASTSGIRDLLHNACYSHIETSGNRPDPIWIFADGSAIRQFDYDDLFAVASGTYNGFKIAN